MERFKLKVAVYILLIKEGKIFLMRRNGTGWQDGQYGLPAGHLEEGEGVVEGLLREVKEETDVDIKKEDVEFVHLMHRKGEYIDIFFLAKAWAGEPKIMEEDKCDNADWFLLEGLPENTISSVKFALGNYQKGIQFSEFDFKEW